MLLKRLFIQLLLNLGWEINDHSDEVGYEFVVIENDKFYFVLSKGVD